MSDWINRGLMGLHIVIMLFTASYAFLFKKSFYDYFFLLYLYLVLLHWTFFNGECCITYLYKKIEDPEYIAGSNLKNELVMNFPSVWLENAIKVHNIVSMLNLYIVARRIRISPYFYVSFILLYEIYFYGIHLFDSCYSKEYLLFEAFLKYSLILGMILFLTINYRSPKANKAQYRFV